MSETLDNTRWTISVRAFVSPADGSESQLITDQWMLNDREVAAVFHPEDSLPGAALIYRTVTPMFNNIRTAIEENFA